MDALLPLHWEEAREDAAREEVYRFRYTRYFSAREHLPGTDHAAGKVVLPHDTCSAHYLARTQDGEVAAVGSATAATETALYPEWRDLLELSRLKELTPWLVIISRLVVSGEQRSSFLFGQFCLHLASCCVGQGFHYAAHYCAPALAPLYERLGYRLYGKGKNLSNGGPFRLPMLLVVDDLPYMRRIHSLFRTLGDGQDTAEKKAWVEKAFAVCPELRQTPLCVLPAAERKARLMAACPALAMAAPDTLRSLERGTVFTLEPGDVLAPQGTVEGRFFLLSGTLCIGENTMTAGSLVPTGGAAVRACEKASVLVVHEAGEQPLAKPDGEKP